MLAAARTNLAKRAKQAVQRAREQTAAVVEALTEEVVFTSGATESNNLAILGLRAFGERTGHKHIVSTAVEHKAVLEPLSYLGAHGFDITLVPLPVLAGSNPEPLSALSGKTPFWFPVCM